MSCMYYIVKHNQLAPGYTSTIYTAHFSSSIIQCPLLHCYSVSKKKQKLVDYNYWTVQSYQLIFHILCHISNIAPQIFQKRAWNFGMQQTGMGNHSCSRSLVILCCNTAMILSIFLYCNSMQSSAPQVKFVSVQQYISWYRNGFFFEDCTAPQLQWIYEWPFSMLRSHIQLCPTK